VKEYRNYIFLGLLFAVCFVGALHASHDGDQELMAFSIDSGKQILAAILTVLTIEGMRNHERKTDNKVENKVDSTLPPLQVEKDILPARPQDGA